MDNEKTTLFEFDDLESEEIRVKLKEIYDALEERGYNPVNQIVGYLISGDLGYISSHKDARKKMQSMDRARIVEVLLKDFERRSK